MRRAWPWLVLAIASAACVLAWWIISRFPEPKSMPATWYDAWEWAFGIGVFGGLLSALTAWALPGWGQRIVCFLLSLVVALAAFITMGAFI